MEIDLKGTKAEVTKVMMADPRRIGAIHIKIYFPPLALLQDEKKRDILRRTALTCPVYHSLHPDIDKNVTFIF
jgi:uncharacterized OsmC-like protein